MHKERGGKEKGLLDIRGSEYPSRKVREEILVRNMS